MLCRGVVVKEEADCSESTGGPGTKSQTQWLKMSEITHLVVGDTGVGGEDQGDNETVQTQNFGENEDKNL